MEVKKQTSGTRSSALIFAAVVAVCTLLIAVIAVLVGDRFRTRFDMSVAGGTRLSERTRTALDSIRGDHLLLVAADLRGADIRSITDLLDELHARTPAFDYKFIDTSGASGSAELAHTIQSLAQREKTAVDDEIAKASNLIQEASKLTEITLSQVAPALVEIAQKIPNSPTEESNREYFTQAGAQLRLAARDGNEAIKRAQEFMAPSHGIVSRPDKAGQSLSQAMKVVAEQMDAVLQNVQRFATSAGAAADLATALAPILKLKRDESAVLAERATRIVTLDIHRVLDALASGNGAVLIAPPQSGQASSGVQGVVGISLDAIIGSGNTPWSLVRAEEAITTALILHSQGRGPIVVLVHGEGREVLSDRSVTILDSARSLLASRGIDLVEWACAVKPQEPGVGQLLTTGPRPIVYVILSPDSTGSGPGGTGVERAEKLGKVVTSLLARGESLCVSLNPSIVATYGETDPVVKALAPFGLTAQSGKPLLREVFNQGVRSLQTDFVVVGPQDAGKSLVAKAVSDLPVTLPWPVALNITNLDTVRWASVLRLDPKLTGVWGESQWLALWQTPRERRANISDLPKFDSGRDIAVEVSTTDARTELNQGIIVAAEFILSRSGGVDAKRVGPLQSQQRAVVIASNAWLVDSVTQRAAMVDGRRVMLSPGNLELLEASIQFLAGRDAMIATSAAGTPPPMVTAIDEHKLLVLRWSLIAGLPGIALLIGGLVALVRSR